jgi:lipopolysaccharide kinase (Kdo/WaaP) family protein
MTASPPPDDIIVERWPAATVYRKSHVERGALAAALEAPGELLQHTRKYRTRRVGNWVLKESLPNRGIGPLKHTFQRARCRRAWIAANFLDHVGLAAPAPVAFVERGSGGIILGNTFVMEYLEGCADIEVVAADLAARNATEMTQVFLYRLADTLQAWANARAYHSDLKGRNVMTRNNERFYMTDLDCVTLNRVHTDEMRLRNHVQLYESLLRHLDEETLAPFLEAIVPMGTDVDAWTAQVKRHCAERIARRIKRSGGGEHTARA